MQVQARFASHTGADRYETTRVVLVPADADDGHPAVAAVLPDLAGCSLGAWALFRMYHSV
jgi:hypothetical protein